jgi:hypothetical protein
VVAVALLLATGIPTKSNFLGLGLFVGRNVNLAPYPIIENGLPVVNSGDPYLQRQNEPSMAVSTRNPMHLLAATNDYRTVYIPTTEGALPGIELAAQAQDSGDAWVGIFKSYNGGQSWTTHLLPGYPQDGTADGLASPLKAYEAACDPTVRAGASGLFFTSGIGFDRTKNGGSAIFVARYIDYNMQAIGEMDSIEYIDTTTIEEGTSGQFADKPWIAVAAPNDENDTVLINANTHPQHIPRFDVYIVYSIFLGSAQSGGGSKIMFAKSSDCGNTWGKTIKLSEDVHICQGTNVVVSPEDGTIYVVWRQYAREEEAEPDAIIMCKSTDGGLTFTKGEVFAEINPFDQFTYSAGWDYPQFYRFRTSAFPAIAVDHNGLVYVAWSQRGEGPNGEPRIVIRTMKGSKFSDPEAIDNHDLAGHQIMPSLAYAGGKILATWYDTRNSPLNMATEIIGEAQTMDVRAAQADPSSSTGKLSNPVFGDSVQVSRYLYTAEIDGEGNLVGEDPFSPVSETNPPVIKAAQADHPNRPIFEGGNSPFMGDYLDSAPSPMIMRDYENGTWRFNTGEGPFDSTLTHIVFASNRDVVPPTGDLTWGSYQPPGPGCLDELTTGMRDQNVYTAPVTQGIQVYCPVNTKPLSLERSSFLVFVRNLTDNEKIIRLTIDAPLNMNVSFWEFGPPQQPETSEECPFPFDCAERIVEMAVLPHSSITLTVFVRQPYAPSDTTFRVNVEEIDKFGSLTGLKTAILINPDPVNTNLIIPGEVVEYHTPFVITEDVALVDCDDATVLSGVVFTQEQLAELLEYSNPDYLAPTRRHPTRRHEGIINPTRRHAGVYGAPDGEVTDVSWSVENRSGATAAYSFDLLGETPSVPYQLLIYRVSTTQYDGCDLSEFEHHELLLSYEDPSPESPTRRHEDLRNPTRRHNTFFLAPGETAICTLRLIDENPSSESEVTLQSTQTSNGNGTLGGSFDPDFYANTVTGAFIPQAANENQQIDVTAFMWIYTTTLTDGYVNDPYGPVQLEVEGGSGSYTWSLVPGYENLPPGLKLTLDGIIQLDTESGFEFIEYDEPYDYDAVNDIYSKTYNFAVQVYDGEQTAARSLSIKVILKTHNIYASAGEGGTISPSGTVKVFHGFDQEFIITPEDCYDIDDVVVDSGSVGAVATHTIGNVREDHTIHAAFYKLEYTITATAGANGSISPPPGDVNGDVIVDCGTDQTFLISPDSCYTVADVLVDGVSVGAVTSYTFDYVEANHTIHATFAPFTYTITPTAGVGGSINPSDPVSVSCGLDQTFTITTDEGYLLVDIKVDGISEVDVPKGPVTTYTFYNVQADHDIEAIFKKLEAWVQRYNNEDVNGNDGATDIAADSSGNSYVTGTSLGRTTGEDFYTIIYASDGTEVLSGRADGPAHDGDVPNAIAIDNSGNVSVTGDSYRGTAGDKHKDYLTTKYNISTGLDWDSRYDARRNGHDVATGAAFDSAGNVYVTGRSEDSDSKQSDIKHFDYYTIKYDKNRGRTKWGARYNSPGNGHDRATGIAVDEAGYVYVTGFSYDGPNNDIVTIKYDPNNGNPVWPEVLTYGVGLGGEAAAIAVRGGFVYVTGRMQGGATDFDYITIKYATNGDFIWARTYNNSPVDGHDEAVALAVDAEGNVFVTGLSSNGPDDDYVTIKYNSFGNLDWEMRFDGENGIDEATDIAVDSVGDVYVTGRSQVSGTNFDYYTIKYDNSGNLIWRARYDNSLSTDEAVAIAIFEDPLLGYVHVYVTGRSNGSGTGFDYATVKYEQY